MRFDLEEELRELRRTLHQIPETGHNLPKTKDVLRAWFAKKGIILYDLAGGLAADIGNPKAAKRILWRADMDALPVQDVKTAAYRSRHGGACHACGHDAHMAMLYGAAALVQENGSDYAVRLMLQPNEECPPGGALPMVEAGLLDGVDAAYALHVSPDLPAGSVGIKSGILMAATDNFTLTVTGKGGHGAMPHKAADAVVAAAHLIVALQSLPSRYVDPLEPVVVTVGKINGGTAHNVIADKVIVEGTVRTLSNELREKLPKRLEFLCRQVASAFGCSCEMDYCFGYPVLYNDTGSVWGAEAVLYNLFGKEKVHELQRPLMGGEDFAYVLEKVPGALIFLGTGDENFRYPLHHSLFDFNDDILAMGAKLLYSLPGPERLRPEHGCQESCNF